MAEAGEINSILSDLHMSVALA